MVAVYLILAMSYTASGTTMPDFQAMVVNVSTLPPAASYLFVVRLKFIPLFVLALGFWVVRPPSVKRGSRPASGAVKAYNILGLFLTATLICMAWTAGWGPVFQAAWPGRWKLVEGAAIVRGHQCGRLANAFEWL